MALDNFEIMNKYYTYARPEMVLFIPRDSKKILDIGCGEGLFLALLKKEGNMETWGVEINPEIAEVAQRNLDKVLAGDILEVVQDIPDLYFDCIVFNDVLEHMVNPDIILTKIKVKLNTDGVIVCSIPNVRHIRVLRDLLIKKQWKYEDLGILDKTHLRFFTKKSIIDMFNGLGYQIIKIEGICATKWWKFIFFNILTLGFFADSRYMQFACIVKPK